MNACQEPNMSTVDNIHHERNGISVRRTKTHTKRKHGQPFVRSR
jgi:hypothetical protein